MKLPERHFRFIQRAGPQVVLLFCKIIILLFYGPVCCCAVWCACCLLCGWLCASWDSHVPPQICMRVLLIVCPLHILVFLWLCVRVGIGCVRECWGSHVPPWMYMRVFFAVGLPKKGRAHAHSRFHVIRAYHARYSMRSLQSQHCLPVFKTRHTQAPAEIFAIPQLIKIYRLIFCLLLNIAFINKMHLCISYVVCLNLMSQYFSHFFYEMTNGYGH